MILMKTFFLWLFWSRFFLEAGILYFGKGSVWCVCLIGEIILAGNMIICCGILVCVDSMAMKVCIVLSKRDKGWTCCVKITLLGQKILFTSNPVECVFYLLVVQWSGESLLRMVIIIIYLERTFHIGDMEVSFSTLVISPCRLLLHIHRHMRELWLWFSCITFCLLIWPV